MAKEGCYLLNTHMEVGKWLCMVSINEKGRVSSFDIHATVVRSALVFYSFNYYIPFFKLYFSP